MVGNSSSNTAGKPIRCKAAIVRKPGEPLVIEEVIVAPPKQREVRIKIICTSLCHSDFSFWKLKDLQINWYEALMKIHGRLKIGDSWIIQNHVWVLLKCVKLDSAQVFPPPYHWRSELELQALCSTI